MPFGASAARKLSSRVGHLHITVDDRSWADYGQSDTLILTGLQRGPHKGLIEVVGPEAAAFTKQTVSLDAPGKRDRG
jgi:hypothetical protein